MIPLLLAFQSLLAPIVPVDTVRFGVVGDSQGNNFNTFGTICSTMAREGIQCFVGLGDHTQNPGEWPLQWTLPLTPIAHLPRFGCVGNHDPIQEYAQHVWPIPQHPLTSIYGNAIGCWGAVTVGNCRLVFLDTNEAPAIVLSLAAGAAQQRWLVGELGGSPWADARYRIVAWHHPARTEQWDGGCLYPPRQERLWLMDVCAAAHPRADLILNGHSHAYQRGHWPAPGGVAWIISGGGGGWLDTTRCWNHPEITVSQAIHHYLTIEATPDTLTVVAKSPLGVEFDRLVVR